MATGFNPACSYRWIISPMTFFLTASGLMMANVRSLMIPMVPPDSESIHSTARCIIGVASSPLQASDGLMAVCGVEADSALRSTLDHHEHSKSEQPTHPFQSSLQSENRCHQPLRQERRMVEPTA